MDNYLPQLILPFTFLSFVRLFSQEIYFTLNIHIHIKVI